MSFGHFGPPTELVPQATAKDASDLDLLATLHYVWSGLLSVGTLGVIAYFVLLAGVFGFAPTGHGAPASGVAVAGVLLVVGVVMALVLVALVTLHILAASGLKKRTRRTLTFVASVMMCTSFPLGTALGVWTIMVLGRPGVKALYGVP